MKGGTRTPVASRVFLASSCAIVAGGVAGFTLMKWKSRERGEHACKNNGATAEAAEKEESAMHVLQLSFGPAIRRWKRTRANRRCHTAACSIQQEWRNRRLPSTGYKDINSTQLARKTLEGISIGTNSLHLIESLNPRFDPTEKGMIVDRQRWYVDTIKHDVNSVSQWENLKDNEDDSATDLTTVLLASPVSVGSAHSPCHQTSQVWLRHHILWVISAALMLFLVYIVSDCKSVLLPSSSLSRVSPEPMSNQVPWWTPLRRKPPEMTSHPALCDVRDIQVDTSWKLEALSFFCGTRNQEH